MGRSALWVIVAIFLAISPATAAAAEPGVMQLLSRARFVVEGTVSSVVPYDDGRFTVAHLQMGRSHKGKLEGKEALVVERHDLPSSRNLLQADAYVVTFLAPAKRTSSLRQALPAGNYYEVVGGRSGVISNQDPAVVREAAGIVARMLALANLTEPDGNTKARALVFDEIGARHPALVADGAAGLPSIRDLASTLAPQEQQRLEVALARTDLDTWVRIALVNAVAELGLKELVPTLRRLPEATPELQRVAWSALTRLGAAPKEEDLRPSLDSEDASIRAAATQALITATGAAAIPEVTRLALSDPERTVRIAAVDALGESHLAEALPSLERIFSSSETEVRQAAARAIHTIGGRPAIETFARLAFAGEPESQKYATVLLLVSGVAQDDPLLVRIRNTHPSEEVRRIATEGLELHDGH